MVKCGKCNKALIFYRTNRLVKMQNVPQKVDLKTVSTKKLQPSPIHLPMPVRFSM